LSRDIDLFVHDRGAHRELVAGLSDIAGRVSATVTVLRDAGTHVRGRLELAGSVLELDVVHEALPDLAGAEEVESVLVESERDALAHRFKQLAKPAE
jgi:hypothetical protein